MLGSHPRVKIHTTFIFIYKRLWFVLSAPLYLDLVKHLYGIGILFSSLSSRLGFGGEISETLRYCIAFSFHMATQKGSWDRN